MTVSTHIAEIFNSIQGEGIFTGVRQVFVRFQGCPLHCGYCDTPQSRKKETDVCRVEYIPGSREYGELQNPIDIAALSKTVQNLWSSSTTHLALTGGEPLMHVDYINELSGLIDRPLYLETNGCLPDEARKVRYFIDIAACDIKLPEHNADLDYPALLKNELKTAGIFYQSGATTFVKTVITHRTSDDSIRKISRSLSDIDDTIPYIMQPVTPCPGFEPPSPKRLLELMDIAGDHLKDVRAIPQVHKTLGQQ